MGDPEAQERHDPRVLALKAGLLAAWAAVSFGMCFFARDMQFIVAGWPFGFWVAAHGAVLAFIAIIVAYSVIMKRLAPGDNVPPQGRNADA